VARALLMKLGKSKQAKDHMLRITEYSQAGNEVRLRLDGTLDAVSWRDLEAICSRHRCTGNGLIILDLGGVVFMTGDVAKKLTAARGDGLRMIKRSPFIETLLNTTMSSDTAFKTDESKRGEGDG